MEEEVLPIIVGRGERVLLRIKLEAKSERIMKLKVDEKKEKELERGRKCVCVYK